MHSMQLIEYNAYRKQQIEGIMHIYCKLCIIIYNENLSVIAALYVTMSVCWSVGVEIVL